MTTKPKKRAKPYFWFQGESVASLTSELNKAGAGAILEVHVDGKKVHLRVVSPDYNGPLINDSRACPPICPH